MGHPGEKHQYEMLQKGYYNPKSGKDYSLLTECKMQIDPWEELVIDLIGPWFVKVNNQKVEFNALMCIDTASTLVNRYLSATRHHTTSETKLSSVG